RAARGRRGLLVRLGPRGRPGPRDLPEPMGPRARKGRWGRWDLLVRRGPLEHRGRQGRAALLDRRGPPDPLDLPVWRTPAARGRGPTASACWHTTTASRPALPL